MKLLQVAIAFDQQINTLLGGYADETLSSRAWRCQNKSKFWRIARSVIDSIFFWQPNHCSQAYLAEKLRKQLPDNFYNI